MTTSVIAIDGTSASGKSTIARAVAAKLGIDFLETGAMYRAVALGVLETQTDPGNETECAKIAHASDIVVTDKTFLNGRDVSELIRTPEVTRLSSLVAVHPSVRTELIARQRAWLHERGEGVMEGRDIGTVVFPDAALKVYVTASEEERARRRLRDEEQINQKVDIAQVKSAIEARDTFDSTKGALPPEPEPDMLVIDTTGRSVEDIATELAERYRSAVGAG